MNAPDKPVIAFLQWPKGDAQLPPERKLPLVGFNRDRTALLVYDERDRRCALRLAPPSLFNIRYHEAPLAENSTPVAIRRTVLHEPPCRQTRKQAERLLSPNQLSSLEGMSLWEKFAPVVQHLAGTEAEDRELSRRFEAHKKRRLAEYEDRLRHIEELPAEQKEKEKKHLEGLFMTARPGRPQSGEKPLSEFDVTLDDVKAGALGIRDEYLIQKFCRSYGFDRTEIKENSERFRHWLAGVAHREGVDDPNRPERIPLHALASWLEALEAAVRYELSFANGRKVWLEAVEETTVLSPQDGEDFDAQEAEALRADEDERLQKEKEIVVEKRKLTAEETNLETERKKNLEVEARLAQERAKEPVSRADCLAELKVGPRQFLNLLKNYHMDEPTTRRQLDVLLTKHQRRKKGLGESLGKRNKARAEERRGG